MEFENRTSAESNRRSVEITGFSTSRGGSIRVRRRSFTKPPDIAKEAHSTLEVRPTAPIMDNASGLGRFGVGSYYQERDYPHFDYSLATAESLPGWELRGPIPDLEKPYFVCIGATQVFGRFCTRPFPQILSEELGLPVLNLGMGGHGPRTFVRPDLLSAINRAEFAIVQLASARIGSNSFFENSESGRAPGRRLRDDKEMVFEQFLVEEFDHSPHEVIARLVQETRDSWIASYRELLGAITVPTILHWLSTVLPQRIDDYSSSVWELLGAFPQLVNSQMIGQIRLMCDSYVETVSRKGLPQPLWEASEAVSGTELRNGMLYNSYYPSPEIHEAAARDLARPARALAGSRRPKLPVLDRGTLVVSCTEESGKVVSAWCGPHASFVTYDQIRQDRDLLTYLLERRPFIVHVKWRNLLEAYLQRRFADSVEANMPSPADVNLQELTLFAHVTLEQEWRAAGLSRFQDVLEVWIEDCAGDPQSTFKTVSEFIQRPRQLSEDMPKMAPFPEISVHNRALLEITFKRLMEGVTTFEA